MSWKPELEEIARREALAREMGGADRIERARRAGRMTVRERIDRIVDPGTFRETGALAARVEYDEDGKVRSYTPSNFICGRATIGGRPVVVGGDDFTVRGGAADGAIGNKMGWAEKAAHELRIPLVRLVDGTGGGGSVKTQATTRRSYVPFVPDWNFSVELLSRVPVAAAALGPVAGLGAARVAASHFSVMVRGSSQLFVAGPPVVRRALWGGRSKRRNSGARTSTREAAAPSTTRLEASPKHWNRSGAFSPTCRIPSSSCHLAQTPRTIPSAARKRCCRSCRGTGARPTRCGNFWSSCWTGALYSRWAATSVDRW
jgi:acetyl-CoA carboxylase carboxyltransferase component